MEYKENMLCYEDYYRLRKSVDWLNFSELKKLLTVAYIQ